MAVQCKKCGGPHPAWDCHAPEVVIRKWVQAHAAPIPKEAISVLVQEPSGKIVEHLTYREKRQGRPRDDEPSKGVSPRAAEMREYMRKWREDRRKVKPK